MKVTGTGRLRQNKCLNKPQQDGIKAYLLCNNCEKEFAKSEDWFKKNIFQKYLSNHDLSFEISDEFIYFVVSILWRVVIYFKDDGNVYRFKNEFDLAASEWKDFLLNHSPLNSFKSIHIIFIPETLNIEGGGKNIYSYFHRSVDIEIAESNGKAFVYAKFSRFILLGMVTGIEESDFESTNILEIDKLNPLNQTMDDADVVDFIIERSTHIKDYKNLSSKQQHLNDKYFKTRIGKIKGNDYWQAFIKDLKNTGA
ncbi:MAG: hypothetical protein IPH69_05345 [Bacteroidales bacterium]|nr:hypothetical protein [Bacteroidales bacterium]